MSYSPRALLRKAIEQGLKNGIVHETGVPRHRIRAFLQHLHDPDFPRWIQRASTLSRMDIRKLVAYAEEKVGPLPAFNDWKTAWAFLGAEGDTNRYREVKRVIEERNKY